MKKKRTEVTVETLFPHPRGRAAGDAAIDALPMHSTLSEAVDAFEAAYFAVTGYSPFRDQDA